MTCCLTGPGKLFILRSLCDLAKVHIGTIFDVRSVLRALKFRSRVPGFETLNEL
jgi:hypothetical protein